MSASADVLAQAKVEIALDAIPEGKNVRIPHTLHEHPLEKEELSLNLCSFFD